VVLFEQYQMSIESVNMKDLVDNIEKQVMLAVKNSDFEHCLQVDETTDIGN